MPVGTLTVELQAATAKFESDLKRASEHATASAREIDKAFGELKTKVLELGAAFGLAFSADAFVETVKGAIEAEAALQRLGERAGLTGSQFSAFTYAARQSQTDLADVATMSARLSKALIEGQDAGSKSAVVLRALGISSGDTARLLEDPVQAVVTLAKRLNELPEGGTKAAAQLLILGRAGGTTSAFLKELAEQQHVVATRTQEQVLAAKHFEDSLTDLRIRSDDLKTQFANALLPTLGDVVKALGDLQDGAGGVRGAVDGLAADGSIQQWARDTVLALATVGESLVLITRLVGSFIGSVNQVTADIKVLSVGANAPKNKLFGSFGYSKDEADKANAEFDAAVTERNAILERANKRYTDLWNANGAFLSDAIQKQFAISDAVRKAATQPDSVLDARDLKARQLNDAAAKAAGAAAAAKAKAVQDAINKANLTARGDDPTKKILEGDLIALEASIAEEKQILGTRKEFLQQYYEQGFISIKEFYDKRRATETEGLAFETAARNQEIAALQAYIARRDTTEVNRQDSRNKIIEIQKRQAAADQEAAKQGTLLWFQEQQAAKQYQRTLVDIHAQLLALQGNTAQSTALRLQSQNADLRKQLAVNGDTGALKQLNEVERLTVAQAALNDQQTAYSTILQDLANVQGRIDLNQSTGSITSLDAMKQKAEAAGAWAAALRPVADAYLRIAEAAKNPAMIIAAQKLELELDTLAAQADAVAKKFTDIFTGAFADAITEFVTGTKSAKDALKDLGKSLEQQLAHIAAQNVAEQLFGKNGPLSGVGGFFANIFTGGKSGGGAAAADAGLSSVGSSATISSTSLQLLASAAQTASAALLSVGAGSLTGGFAGLGGGFSDGSLFGGFGDFGGFPGFASGTNFAPGGMALVGERGPEVVNLPRGAQVIPNHALKSKGSRSNVVHIHVNVPAGTSRATADQIAVRSGREVRRALARNA